MNSLLSKFEPEFFFNLIYQYVFLLEFFASCFDCSTSQLQNDNFHARTRLFFNPFSINCRLMSPSLAAIETPILLTPLDNIPGGRYTLRCTFLYCIIWYYIILWYITLPWYILLYHIILYHIVFSYIILYYTILYYTLICYIVPYYLIVYCIFNHFSFVFFTFSSL